MCVLSMLGVASAADYWVAPNGDDSNPGTKSEPFKSLDGARQAVRASEARGKEPINVYFQSGTYYLPEKVVFTAADSGTRDAPITYLAAEENTAIISGGQLLKLDWKPYKSGIFQAKVPAGMTFDQFFVNSQRQHMARYPNYNPQAQYFQGFSRDCTSSERVKGWKSPAGGYLHAMQGSLWGDMHWLIKGKTEEGGLDMEGGWQNNCPTAGHAEFRFVENIFEELDAPNEWYLNTQTDTLYYYKPADVDLDQAKIEIVHLPHLIEFIGTEQEPVKFVNFAGMTITHAMRTFMDNKEPILRSDWTTYRGGAIVYDGVEDCVFRD